MVAILFVASNAVAFASYARVESIRLVISCLLYTSDLQNTAESEEVRFALGEAENPHDLLIAETKANVALQYTVAVRDKLIDGYKEIMQMSI